jgi:hypothetical protein
VEGGWGVGAICTRVPRGVGGWGPMAEAGKAHWRGVDIPCGCSFMFATAAITTRRRPSINTVNAAVVVHGMDGRPSVCVIRNVPSLCRVGPGARRACFPIIFFPPFEFIFLMIGTKLISTRSVSIATTSLPSPVLLALYICCYLVSVAGDRWPCR